MQTLLQADLSCFHRWHVTSNAWFLTHLLTYSSLLSQSVEPQSTPSGDPSSIAMVRTRVPDTNVPASPNTQRAGPHNPLSSSEYSLFELETFFNRWAPDGGPFCSFNASDSVECDQDGITIVKKVPRTQLAQESASSARQMCAGQSSSSAVHTQTTVSQGETWSL